MLRLTYFFLLIALHSCIGTDIIEEITVPEMLDISSAASSLKVGESFHFMADYFDTRGNLSEANIMWSSSDPTVIAVNGDGEATALMLGNVYVIASFNNLKDSVMVEAGEETVLQPNERVGSFQGSNNYVVEGDFELVGSAGNLLLNFASNFNTSNGPGLHVYLSNQSTNVSGGIDLGELKQNKGVQQYELPENVNLNTYDFVIIYCKPFGVVFGFGKLP